ncbi:MAG: HAD family hydrolase [Acidobacteria bacterium]|nr:HAD family hydrolase [Acidobacteriota bacterium]
METAAVLFDFDFTLGDSSAGIIECVNRALTEMGLGQANPEIIATTIGLSLETMFGRLTGLDAARALEFRQRFIHCADRIMTRHTRLYPWAPALLRELRARGCALGIVTTKRSYRIAEVLDREHLTDTMDIVVGSDMVTAPKPSPEGLLLAARRLGRPLPSVLYAGDTVTDAEAAHLAGIPFAAVLSGTTPTEAFEAFAPRAILPDARGVLDLIDQLHA